MLDQNENLDLSQFPRVTKRIAYLLDGLFEMHPPREVEKFIQEVWGTYLIHSGDFTVDFSDIASFMYFLLNFLQVADAELDESCWIRYKEEEE